MSFRNPTLNGSILSLADNGGSTPRALARRSQRPSDRNRPDPQPASLREQGRPPATGGGGEGGGGGDRRESGGRRHAGGAGHGEGLEDGGHGETGGDWKGVSSEAKRCHCEEHEEEEEEERPERFFFSRERGAEVFGWCLFGG